MKTLILICLLLIGCYPENTHKELQEAAQKNGMLTYKSELLKQIVRCDMQVCDIDFNKIDSAYNSNRFKP